VSIVDDIFGRGATDARFTNWDTARNFVFETIVNNPRLSDVEKIELQKIEEAAYQSSSGKFLESETREIGRYYNYLKNNFPSVTDDARFLAIFEAADTVQASAASVTADDIEIPKSVAIGLPALVGGALALYLLFRD